MDKYPSSNRMKEEKKSLEFSYGSFQISVHVTAMTTHSPFLVKAILSHFSSIFKNSFMLKSTFSLKICK